MRLSRELRTRKQKKDKGRRFAEAVLPGVGRTGIGPGSSAAGLCPSGLVEASGERAPAGNPGETPRRQARESRLALNAGLASPGRSGAARAPPRSHGSADCGAGLSLRPSAFTPGLVTPSAARAPERAAWARPPPLAPRRAAAPGRAAARDLSFLPEGRPFPAHYGTSGCKPPQGPALGAPAPSSLPHLTVFFTCWCFPVHL